MVTNLSKQLAPFGITVNNVAPDVIATPHNYDALADEAYRKQVLAGIPCGYAGKAEDCAGQVLLLCSDAGRYMTGENIFIDGGEIMRFNVKEEIIALTPQWKGERFPDGRPKVADRYLKALHSLTLEEVWKPIFVKGYESQFEGRLHTLHDDGRKLVGCAVTATFAPTRPDLHETMFAVGMAEGRKDNYNQWVIDSLVEGDVVVADMYDKIYKGTFLGGNLTTAIKAKTKTGGAVIWGGVRDVEQMKKVPDVQVYYRGIDPTPIRDFIMTGFNTPTRIGGAIVLPGDIVFGAGGGVLFIPAHLVAEVVDGASKTQVKDIFGFEMITQNKFTTAQIDRNTWTEEMLVC